VCLPACPHFILHPPTLPLGSYEIREDIADVLKRVGPYLGDDDRIGFSGWARMAQTIDKFAVTEVRKPKVGENKPAGVTGEACVGCCSGVRLPLMRGAVPCLFVICTLAFAVGPSLHGPLQIPVTLHPPRSRDHDQHGAPAARDPLRVGRAEAARRAVPAHHPPARLHHRQLHGAGAVGAGWGGGVLAVQSFFAC